MGRVRRFSTPGGARAGSAQGKRLLLRAVAVLCVAAGSSAVTWPGEAVGGKAAAKACFGAAARDPEEPCVNRKLDFVAIPSPRDALLQPSAPCRLIQRRPEVCGFGVGRKVAAPSVALVGDSHAVHWRAALAVVARKERWRGVTIYRSGCPFSVAKRPTVRCGGWVRRVLRWLTDHPGIRTVYVSANSGPSVLAPPGQEAATKINGYASVWEALPSSVREVFVLHDVPDATTTTGACVARAVARHHEPGIGCARSRAAALATDHQAVAAEQFASDRVEAIDLTPFMCDDQQCFPVVGGALVIKDIGHLTRTFSTTLAPFLRRAVWRTRVSSPYHLLLRALALTTDWGPGPG